MTDPPLQESHSQGIKTLPYSQLLTPCKFSLVPAKKWKSYDYWSPVNSKHILAWQTPNCTCTLSIHTKRSEQKLAYPFKWYGNDTNTEVVHCSIDQQCNNTYIYKIVWSVGNPVLELVVSSQGPLRPSLLLPAFLTGGPLVRRELQLRLAAFIKTF